MNWSLKNSAGWRVLVAAFGLAVAAAAHADDTEVFVGQTSGGPDAARPNILFIIDTSGSMDTLVETQAEWDPGSTFEGCYRSDALYFATGATAPPCGSGAYVFKSVNRCAAAASALEGRGQYAGRVLGWQNGPQRWEPLDPDDGPDQVECEADRGIDGGGSSTRLYAGNGADGPWAADDSQEPAWNETVTLFDGNWLNWRDNPPTVMRTRLQVVKNVVNGLLDTIENANVGLMRFNDTEGGPVVQAVTDIGSSRAAVKDAVNDLYASGFTPLSETLYEATQYFRGGSVAYGNVGPVRSVAAARQGGDPNATSYRTPIDEQCQKNFIVYLTDGEPTRDTSADGLIASLPGFAGLIGSCDGSGEGACLDDLAEYLFRSDASATVEGVQNIATYTVGIDIDIPLLESTARRGGGDYYLADDTSSLTIALTELLAGIAERASTFVAPSIPVNAFNRAAAEREVFVSLFQPSATVHWPGNLKKYRFVDGQLLDAAGRTAIDPLTGFFQPDVTSLWSADPDGDRILAGGATSRLQGDDGRNLYTDVAGADLTASGNQVETGNGAITAAELGVAEDERDALIRWIRGDDGADLDGDGDRDEPRHQMGDPLHVRPVTLNYGTSAADPETVVFLATNDGLLHAFDADTGNERWAYLPGRLLARQAELRADTPSSGKRYGLDGEISVFLRNNDGEPGIGDGDEAVLVFGMGRGGDAVFAVDVSDPDAPQLRWQVDGTSPRLADLGQVWSAPALTRVRVGTAVRDVVILSGGYDDAQDNRGYRTDTVGHALFVLDFDDGRVIWSAGAPDRGHDLELTDMTNSIPAAPRVIDLTGDGLADRLYVGDTGGRIWRFDLLNGNDAGELGAGGVLASLGAADLTDPPAGAVRRFYATPDVVFVNCTRGTFLAINVGSGFRGHPLDTDAEDAFFSVRDPNVFGARASSAYDDPLGIADLFDITGDATAVVPNDAAGWRLRLAEDPGEKVLSAAITFDRSVFFTSFSPAEGVSTCAGGLGTNRAYQVDACNGRPVNNLDGSADPDVLTVEDRFGTLSQAGIAPEAVFLFPSSLVAGPTRCIGLVCFPPDDGAGGALRRTFWAPQPAR